MSESIIKNIFVYEKSAWDSDYEYDGVSDTEEELKRFFEEWKKPVEAQPAEESDSDLEDEALRHKEKIQNMERRTRRNVELKKSIWHSTPSSALIWYLRALQADVEHHTYDKENAMKDEYGFSNCCLQPAPIELETAAETIRSLTRQNPSLLKRLNYQFNFYCNE
ncbi:unnamed protein product [Bursaphelenchus okinawaensis]|uniref:Uncharacterized protein n=1 Tax=Bursaphelenchus okinawaensis TaxID=465554 RepID=A0A811K3U2_9BILA|nr:unnamed protein product [Bursaphelenchus okinawaensis]CAG9090065.1 unnamed protein product [Bursaphelenchus okinawaensis]